jgi:hypothetical protein
VIVGAVLAGVSLIVRFRRTDGAGRKQIEWLAYAAALVVAGTLATTALQFRQQTEALNNYENGIITLALACIPLAMGIAMLGGVCTTST